MKQSLICATAVAAVAFLSAHAPPPVGSELEDARSEYRQLSKEYAAAMKEFDAEVERLAASDPAEATAYAEAWSPKPAFVDQFAEAAGSYAGTPEAVQFLLWVVQNDDTAEEGLSEACEGALNTLMADHATDEGFFSNVQYFGFRTSLYGEDRVLAILEHVVENAEGDLQNAATYSRGVARANRTDASDEDDALAKADFRLVMDRSPESPVGIAAKGYLFELENLRIGMTAPDIADRDLDGVEFKLSDYLGKVVVLDFWGDW